MQQTLNRSALNNTSTMKNTLKGAEKNKKQEISSEELIMAQQISAVEQSSLDKVFKLLCSATVDDQNIDNSQISKQEKGAEQTDKKKDYFTSKDIGRILNDLGYPASKTEIDQMIWEIDDMLDGHITRYEFELMYKRCALDQTGLEPRNLYNVVQFLMFLQNNVDDIKNKTKIKITVEDTYQILYVKHGRNKLDKEIEEIFGTEQKTSDGQEKELSITEFLQRIKKKDFRDREQLQEERNTVKIPGKEE